MVRLILTDSEGSEQVLSHYYARGDSNRALVESTGAKLVGTVQRSALHDYKYVTVVAYRVEES